MMKRITRILLAFGLFGGAMSPGRLAAASLEVSVKPAHLQFVRDEKLTFAITLKNFGESVFIVDDYGDYLKNKIEISLKHFQDGFLTMKEGIPFENVMVVPQGSQTFNVDLLQWFPGLKEGNYFVQFVIHRGEETVVTGLIKFDIVTGIEIGSVSRPVSGDDTRSRTYTLLYWPREQTEVLFMRVTENPDNNVVGLARLGNVVRHEIPKIEFENNGQLVVTHQLSRDVLVRTTIRSTLSEFDIVKSERIFARGGNR